MPRPMIHSNSVDERDFISSVNSVTTCLYGQGRWERSVPQKQRCGPKASTTRRIFEPKLAQWRAASVYERATLAPGTRIAGPALIVEDQTTVLVTADFDASLNSAGHIVLDKRKKS